jgi:hypothetical protein
METLSGQHQGARLSSIQEGKRSNSFIVAIFSLTLLQVKRAVNPLGGKLGNMIVFGAHILALTEDGRRLLAFATETGGGPPSI